MKDHARTPADFLGVGRPKLPVALDGEELCRCELAGEKEADRRRRSIPIIGQTASGECEVVRWTAHQREGSPLPADWIRDGRNSGLRFRSCEAHDDAGEVGTGDAAPPGEGGLV